MKTTRSYEFLCHLTAWRELSSWRPYEYAELSRQPIYSLVEELTMEEAQRRFARVDLLTSVGLKVGCTVYAPLEVEVDPS
jgi:hypothetical protein